MNKFIILFLLIFSLSEASAQQKMAEFSHGYWKTDIAMGDFLFSTFLTVTKKKDKIVLRSSKNADRRILGFSKSALGRLVGKLPKKGRLLVIKAKHVNDVTDSIIGTARMPVMGNVEFEGTFSEKGNILKGSFMKNGEAIANLNGQKTSSFKTDYKSFYPVIKSLTEKNIYSKQMLQTSEWKNFDEKLRSVTNNATDDIELFLGFNIFSSKLPFSHFNLVFQSDSSLDASDSTPEEPTVIFEEKTPSIAYLNIKNFSSSQNEIAAAFPRIIEKGYQNLIIDLRNNGGGGIEAAMEFASYILNDSVFIGYFITNKFIYGLEDRAALGNLPITRAATTEALIEELKTSPGVRLGAPKPYGRTFKGKIYILTNKNTASTCEPIVYMLKQKKLAAVIGETTAGAMLSAAYFTIQDKYKLVIPIADFLTFDFKRIEKKGVKPDIETSSEDALQKAISEIQK